MFSSVFCTDFPCQLVNTKHAFKDDLVHTTVLDTFVSVNENGFQLAQSGDCVIRKQQHHTFVCC